MATTANATSVTVKAILPETAGVVEETEEEAPEAVLMTAEGAATAAIPATTTEAEAGVEAVTVTEDPDADQGPDLAPGPEASLQEIGGVAETAAETEEMTAETTDVVTVLAAEEVTETAETVEEATGDAETPQLVRLETALTNVIELTETETAAHKTMAPEEPIRRPGLPVRVRSATRMARISQISKRMWKPRSTTKPPLRRRSQRLPRQRAQPKESQPKTRKWPIQKKKSECESGILRQKQRKLAWPCRQRQFEMIMLRI